MTACFGDERHTKSSGPIVPGRRDPSFENGNAPTPSRSRRSLLLVSGPPSSFCAPYFGWSLLLFIPLFRSSSSYTCQSSMPILKCTSPQPFFLTLCELLWPPSPCPGVTSTSKEVIAFLRTASPPIPLWLAHMAWNLFGDPRVGVLGQCGNFFSHDFGLPRTGSSSAVHSSNLDSFHSSLGTSSSSAWALGLRWNGPKPLGPSDPHRNYLTMISKKENL